MRQYMGTIHRGKFSGGQFSVGQITKGTLRAQFAGGSSSNTILFHVNSQDETNFS